MQGDDLIICLILLPFFLFIFADAHTMLAVRVRLLMPSNAATSPLPCAISTDAAAGGADRRGGEEGYMLLGRKRDVR